MCTYTCIHMYVYMCTYPRDMTLNVVDIHIYMCIYTCVHIHVT